MNKHLLRGTGVAVVTPYNEDYKVDYPSLERVLDHVIEGGVDYIVSLGSTGEAVMLDALECRQVLSHTLAYVNNRVPVIVGMFGGNNTTQLLHRFEAFDFSGFAAVMSSSPAYVKPPQEGIFRHYKAIARISPLPILLYNVPGRTCSTMSPEMVLRLAKTSSKFLGIKDATGDLVQGTRIIKEAPDHFAVVSGDDPTALGLIAMGGQGVISVLANALPRQFSDMVNAALESRRDAAMKIHQQLIDVHPWLYKYSNPSGIKALMQDMGICSGRVRLPLMPLPPEGLAGLRKATSAILASESSLAL